MYCTISLLFYTWKILLRRRFPCNATHITIFTARPEAQRCQVTPYVVNVVVVVGGRVTDSEIKVLPAFWSLPQHTMLHNFCSPDTPTYFEGGGGGRGLRWAGVNLPPSAKWCPRPQIAIVLLPHILPNLTSTSAPLFPLLPPHTPSVTQWPRCR